jgi:hypothetical protein
MKPFLAGVLLAAVTAVTVIAAGCAAQSSTPPPTSQGPRSRCLSNPNESGGMRPLVFLFCVESP